MAKMAKRIAARRRKTSASVPKRPGTRGSGTGQTTSRRKANRKTASRRRSAKRAAALKTAAPKPTAHRKPARLHREPLTLEEMVPTPPSSLDLRRYGSAVRTGRRELKESLHEHGAMTPAITGGDVDADWENAYFSGDEAPGGDNPTPDQEIVDDIGKALGLQYDDNEELKAADKVVERDKHRWELDPASSEDYKERK